MSTYLLIRPSKRSSSKPFATAAGGLCQTCCCTNGGGVDAGWPGPRCTRPTVMGGGGGGGRGGIRACPWTEDTAPPLISEPAASVAGGEGGNAAEAPPLAPFFGTPGIPGGIGGKTGGGTGGTADGPAPAKEPPAALSARARGGEGGKAGGGSDAGTSPKEPDEAASCNAVADNGICGGGGGGGSCEAAAPWPSPCGFGRSSSSSSSASSASSSSSESIHANRLRFFRAPQSSSEPLALQSSPASLLPSRRPPCGSDASLLASPSSAAAADLGAWRSFR
mmetsp:Transcript_7523/g.21494  ORF Transcript_7523/g.21494 Transcript_7523/m.21494 type:complete len:279 (+) Transcript_7523:588-1424(+)